MMRISKGYDRIIPGVIEGEYDHGIERITQIVRQGLCRRQEEGRNQKCHTFRLVRNESNLKKL